MPIALSVSPSLVWVPWARKGACAWRDGPYLPSSCPKHLVVSTVKVCVPMALVSCICDACEARRINRCRTRNAPLSLEHLAHPTQYTQAWGLQTYHCTMLVARKSMHARSMSMVLNPCSHNNLCFIIESVAQLSLEEAGHTQFGVQSSLRLLLDVARHVDEKTISAGKDHNGNTADPLLGPI